MSCPYVCLHWMPPFFFITLAIKVKFLFIIFSINYAVNTAAVSTKCHSKNHQYQLSKCQTLVSNWVPPFQHPSHQSYVCIKCTSLIMQNLVLLASWYIIFTNGLQKLSLVTITSTTSVNAMHLHLNWTPPFQHPSNQNHDSALSLMFIINYAQFMTVKFMMMYLQMSI